MRKCARCGNARALTNSDWCRSCWAGWWTSVSILSQIRVADAKRAKTE